MVYVELKLIVWWISENAETFQSYGIHRSLLSWIRVRGGSVRSPHSSGGYEREVKFVVGGDQRLHPLLHSPATRRAACNACWPRAAAEDWSRMLERKLAYYYEVCI